jgi:hypothetical protein
MGAICTGGARSTPNPEQVDLSHFEIGMMLGKGAFGVVNAVMVCVCVCVCERESECVYL